MLLNYNHLRYFWAVAREGNLTRVAEHMRVSQSALSTQIRKLEHQLGHELFDRRGRKLLLTEAGRLAFEHAEAIFRTGDELVGTLRAQGESQRIIRIGALATLSRNFQMEFLGPLLRQPELEIVLRSGSWEELQAELEALRLDVLLVDRQVPAEPGRQWIVHRLDEQRVGLVGTPRYDTGETLKKTLKQYPLILPTAASGFRMGFDALIDKMGITPLVKAEVDDMAMMRLMAREGSGLAVVPPIVVRDELESGLLKEIHPLPGIVETFYAVAIARKFPNPVLATLLGRGSGEH
ncbi:LysR family transcriptional regulator [Aquibium oceanicum]|uniref:LysR family transcriptional regulator n=1 Tax=Aquibium oceanicum TaxID=1670800 RepID=A0A1L3SXL2_9HYPH|nr:LysR family transcriptional regulator [Aquibium oceanicum]APH74167.1 LysR family transcriptional regulator [Aquibium oceanicum]